MVEGVQQLEIYFGQYLPQLFVAALTPILIFAFVAFLDLPIALVLPRRRARHAVAPGALAPHGPRARAWRARGPTRRSAPSSSTPSRGSPRSRRSGRAASARRAAARRKGQALFESTMWRARHQHAGPRHHRRGHRGRRGGGARLGRLARARGRDGAVAAARHRAHARRRGLPPAARAAHAAAPGHARHLRRAGRLPDPRRRAAGDATRPAAAAADAPRLDADRRVRGRALFVSGRRGGRRTTA